MGNKQLQICSSIRAVAEWFYKVSFQKEKEKCDRALRRYSVYIFQGSEASQGWKKIREIYTILLYMYK